ncbi:SusD/RagB family nutrient-binding outer membrane lipoprotein [Sphingobacterium sp. N143]|uniref:SusD/RagB family nutrient-binding outer membrane lipoprotein n=1 Tax=Sphingobacterium sp. N143 TaxID=2746727 RepID=UPI002577BFDB|nr:SusD/RagB family nutrient-binding outer membrane lipoprotein [Sphingobacterium sp. N143]MDM1295184.1 SusD/RagB family nutrient-binding outer membrane lipoprotein [Sphingobacterium sp. N143]
MKRYIKPLYVGLMATTLLLGSSCTKDFEKINTDPISYGKDTWDPNYTFSSAQLFYTGSFDFAYDTWRGNLIYSATMMQGLSTVVSYWAGDKYLLNENYTAAYWGNGTVGAYIEQVRNIVDVVEFTKDKPKYANLHQVARIWKALIFARLTDLYGDVPYSEAGLGFYNKIYKPKYDKQADIYNDLLKEIETATAALKDDGDNITGDIIYKGDIGKWRKFGNSLLLRTAMRLVKVDPAKAKEYAQKVIGKTMSSNADNAIIWHDVAGSRVTQNRNSQVLLGDGGQENYYVKWSKTFIDHLKSNNDPRLKKVAVTQLYLSEKSKDQNAGFVTDPAKQKGMPNGKDLGSNPLYNISSDPSFTSFADYSSPNPNMIKRTGATFILSFGESELLLAEAAQRWGIGGNAADHYQRGVKAGITFLDQYDASLAISEAEADAYLAAHPFSTAEGLKQINTQYWIHTITMMDFYETWSNWRRTGYPELKAVNYPGNATSGTIPRRFPYPSTEAAINGENYRAASAAVPGGDKLSGRVWWDK